MRAKEREGLVLRTLAAMPFLDRLELAAAAGVHEEAAHVALRSLEQAGLAGFIRHASPLTATTRRWFVTTEGLRLLASENGTDLSSLLRTYPVSAHWRRVLLARLDAVAVVYRLASVVTEAAGPPGFRWYRAAPLDAAMLLPDGSTVGVIRQGPTVDRTSFSDRTRRLSDPERSRPRVLLALMPDEARLRQARRTLARYPGPVYLALERHAARLSAYDRVWQGTSAAAPVSLSEIFARLGPGGNIPWEAPASRLSLPADAEWHGGDDGVADHLLPATLKPSEKRMLDCLADWPLITVEDLSGILELSGSRTRRLAALLNRLGLVTRVHLAGSRRLALSDRGLALLARRDRASVGAALRRWSVEPMDGAALSSWRDFPGRHSRSLARTIEHTQSVHRFMAALVRQARETKGYQVAQVAPPHHAARYFRHEGRLRSIHPDGFGVVHANGRARPFFLEYERRAVNPSTMAARLAPYLRYYSSSRPLEDHEERPLVLIVFEGPLAEANFLGVARKEMRRTEVEARSGSPTGMQRKTRDRLVRHGAARRRRSQCASSRDSPGTLPSGFEARPYGIWYDGSGMKFIRGETCAYPNADRSPSQSGSGTASD